MHHPEDPDVCVGPGATVEVQSIRLALGREIEACRATAWTAMRTEGEHGTIDMTFFIGHVERLSDLDRALALLDNDGVQSRRTAG